jgi:hypothetical protein
MGLRVEIGDRAAARLAWGGLVLACVLVLGGSWFFFLNRSTSYDPVPASESIMPGVFLAFAIVGAPVSAKRPQNPVGWILLAVGIGFAVYTFLIGYSLYGLVTNPGSVPQPAVALAIIDSGWLIGVGLMGTFLLLLFPTGHLPSPRWKPFAWASGLLIVLGSLVAFVLPVDFDNLGFPEITNPLGIEAIRPATDLIVAAMLLGLLLSIGGSVVSLLQRFRRSVGQERLQLKWLVAGSSGAIVLYGLMILAGFIDHFAGTTVPPWWADALEAVATHAFLLIPVAIGIAVLRHRLYDIDRVINRTLVYGTLTLTLGLGYVAAVTLLQLAFDPLTRDNAPAVAGSTLVVASLLGPTRRRIQRFIDRFFYRSKFDAAQVIEDFSLRVRNEVTLETLSANLLRAVNETMSPSHTSLWLRNGPTIGASERK